MKNISFENNNHSIIYAPNSAGKTRQSYAIREKMKDENIIVLSGKDIGGLIDIGIKDIKIGAESSLLKTNEEILKTINKTSDFANEIVRLYNLPSKNASKLKAVSCLFSDIEVNRFNSFELFLGINKNTNKEFVDNNATLEDLIYLDTNLDPKLFKEIKAILIKGINDTINKDNEHIISSELKAALLLISSQIDNNITSCPLCGYDHKDNTTLKEEIKKKINTYITDDEASNREKVTRFINLIDDIRNNTNIKFDDALFIKDDVFSKIQKYITIVNECLNSLRNRLTEIGGRTINATEVGRYLHNNELIETERAKRNNDSFKDFFLNEANRLIALPDGYKFDSKNESILIVDENGKTNSPSSFLSESEQRRLSIVVVFSEINARNISYVIFDDPADTNDDYFFDSTINSIISFLRDRNTLNWIIFTHEIRVVTLFSLAMKDNNMPNNALSDCTFVFYLPDPSYNGNKKPPFHRFKIGLSLLDILNEHEVIIFNKIFAHKLPDYNCDSEMALLASFNQSRCLYKEMIKPHKVSKKNKRLLNKIDKVCDSYEHYVFNSSKRVIFKDLYFMNKFVYIPAGFDDTYFKTNSRAIAVYRRRRFLKRSYSSLPCANPLIKHILFMMLRVYDSHYEYEKKLGDWAKKNLPGFNETTFENSVGGIGCRIGYVKGLITTTTDSITFSAFENTFKRWRTLLNDFSHGASKMFPPYLSISPLEVTRMEHDIHTLPR